MVLGSLPLAWGCLQCRAVSMLIAGYDVEVALGRHGLVQVVIEY